MNIGKIKFDFYSQGSDLGSIRSEAVYGWDIGVLVQKKIGSSFKLRSEFNFIQKGGINEFTKYDLNELEMQLNVNYEYNLNKFDLFIGLGGFVGYIINGEETNLDWNIKIPMTLDGPARNREDIGVVFYSGFSFQTNCGKLFLEGRYRQSITNWHDYTSDSQFRQTFKNFDLGLNIGYLIKLRSK